jgi:hydrogenase nickel incorporation protein HypB
MCKDCGCGIPSEEPHIHTRHAHAHQDGTEHDHPHEHFHHHHGGQAHTHTHHNASDHQHDGAEHRHVDMRQAILDKNDRQAERNRGFFRARGLLVLNVLSSPGSGKTTLLQQTIKLLAPKVKSAVIVGDLATDNDARRLHESGAPVIQITTGTMCHLESEMVARATRELDLEKAGLLIIENVGNLVCPASYDLGEDLRIVLLAVTEGEDKPLKYPPVFQSAHAVVISKIDLAEPCGFERKTALENIRRVAPNATVFELSAKTGVGMERWIEYLSQKHQSAQSRDPLS